jgi:3-keto-5-aminohexanoate cleavage enzyme
MTTVWLEAAVNGPWSRDLQPNIPITVNEIVADGVACAKAGAAIIHVHAYDESTYARMIEGIRGKEDVIVYPTLPLAGSPDAAQPMSAEQRFAAVEELARRGLLEWAVVDPGSVNFAHYDRLSNSQQGFVYLNPEGHIHHGLQLAARYHFHPSYAIYEPGFVRMGAALHRLHHEAPAPIYRLMFSEGFAFGFPPTDYALRAYRQLLEQEAPGAPWMVAGLAVDVRPLISATIAAGGHVRIGLEDAPLGTETTNLAWVEQAAAVIENAGACVATPADVRKALASAR